MGRHEAQAGASFKRARRLWAAAALCVMQTVLGAGCASGEPSPPASAPPKAHVCRFDQAPLEHIDVENAFPGEEHVLYDIPDSPELWAPAPPDEAVTRYRAAVSARLNGAIEPRALLQREDAVTAGLPDGAGEVANATMVAEGRVGTIVRASCLETMLWTWEADRYPMLEHPTEFSAFILRGHGRVRIYASGSERMVGKMRRAISERMEADEARGFALVTHVHNHPFMFDRRVGDRMNTTEATKDQVGGGLAPSITDVNMYRRMRQGLGLQGAWVTNGFDSGHYRAADFDVLVARE